jgi:hypothetical protein
MRNTGSCKHLFGSPERKRLLERPRRRWEDNIKIEPVVWYEGVIVDWI